ncbi:NLI interacting factor [Cinnamomum micranthum f. kanehirae]|uniref:NLI interacting factor n=1 Tax=Cinnamomum micranthum f. kanehirae TaxID=337451 RepID=A0A443NI29_9MAGN|nr:NLI interacting factor [Cinnamomum micranthum f. kanehirae]
MLLISLEEKQWFALLDTVPNGNIDLPVPEGVSGADVERRLNRVDQKLGAESGSSFVVNNPDLRSEPSHQPVAISSSAVTPPVSRPTMPSQKPGLLGASPKQVGPTQPDMNLDMRRKLLMLQNGQGLRDHSSVGPLISRPPAQVLAPPIQSNGGWFVVDEIISTTQNRNSSLHFLFVSSSSKTLLPPQRPLTLILLHFLQFKEIMNKMQLSPFVAFHRSLQITAWFLFYHLYKIDPENNHNTSFNQFLTSSMTKTAAD